MANLPVPIGGTNVPAAALTDVLTSAAGYALAEKSEATRRAYASDFADFAAWCELFGLCPAPAEIATVAGYLAALADRGLKSTTINRRCAAIAYVHRQSRFEPPTSAEPVQAVLRGIRRTIGTAVTRKAPATAKAMKAMVRLIPDTLAGKRDRALLLTGFSAALRRSEIVALDVGDLERAPEGLVVHIRKSKTDQEGEGHQVPIPRGSKLRPVESLEDWLATSGIDGGALFRPVHRGDHLGPGRLTDRAVADIVKRWAKVGNLDPDLFSGHSLRAGYVTSALENGVDAFRVMDQSRHRSVQTLRIYDRRAKLFKNHSGAGFL